MRRTKEYVLFIKSNDQCWRGFYVGLSTDNDKKMPVCDWANSSYISRYETMKKAKREKRMLLKELLLKDEEIEIVGVNLNDIG